MNKKQTIKNYTIPQTPQIERDLAIFLWGKKLSNNAEKNAKKLMPFIRSLLETELKTQRQQIKKDLLKIAN